MVMKYRLNALPERVCWWIAFHLPRQVIHFAAIRLWAFATSGQYGNTNVNKITVTEALTRWERGDCAS